MGSTLRKLQREKKATSPIDPKLMEAWNRGFSAGAREQRKADIEHLVKILESLEEVPGVGEKTAWKVREFFLQKFGREGGSENARK
jgi:aminoglycoside phosphotransferase (APT) family kinase protein